MKTQESTFYFKQLASWTLIIGIALLGTTKPVTAQMQQSVLFVKDFDSSNPPAFTLNSSAGFANNGTNKWVINNSYNGQNIYMDTPPQDSTVGNQGQIGHPNQNYLHIRDFNKSPLSATYDAQNASERWVVMNSGVCTHNFEDVIMAFWWTGNGSPTAFAELYYSTDGGASWNLAQTRSGRTKFRGQQKWKYSEVTMPDFKNQDDLMFAFRWKNTSSSNNGELSFGVDDIIIVGEYDPEMPQADITAKSILPDTVCHEDPNNLTLTFRATFSDTMCPGTYLIEFSDANCDFSGTTYPFATFNINSVHWGSYNISGSIPIPTSIPQGDCYCFRIIRQSAPYIQGTASTRCFTITDCEDSIAIADTPAVLKDGLMGPAHICKNSVIDVPFYSYGGFNPGNDYYLELSDSAGTFRDPDTIGGPSPDATTYDPNIYSPPDVPGSISGKIPGDVPEGCNYYIRVVSSDPEVEGREWGPFCIEECDVETNNGQDINICITDTDSTCIQVPYSINNYDSTFNYQPGNKFYVQLLDNQSMQVVMDSAFGGVVTDTAGGTIQMCIPRMSNFPLEIGKMYYMRIVSTKPSDTTDKWGTIIRFTVNGVGGYPITISVAPDSVDCNTDGTVCFTLNAPYLPSSSTYHLRFYDSQGNLYALFDWTPGQNGHPPLPTVSFNLGIFEIGEYTVRVWESSGGQSCTGPVSIPSDFVIMGRPNPDFEGDLKVCRGDTVTYTADFSPGTYYHWEVNGGTIVDTSNTQVSVVWDSLGFGFYVYLSAVRKCGGIPVRKSVTVLKRTDALALQDTTICVGDTVQLLGQNLTTSFNNKYVWTDLNTSQTVPDQVVMKQGDSITVVNVSPDSTTDYVLKIDNAPPDGCIGYDTVTVELAKANFEDDSFRMCEGDTILLDPNVEDATSFSWIPEDGLSDPTIDTPLAYPEQTTYYSLTTVFENGCEHTANIVVQVDSNTFAISPDDTVAPGQSITLFADGGTYYSWNPANTLQHPTTSEPIATPDSTTTYKVQIVNKNNGCAGKRDVTIYVHEPQFGMPSGFTPNGDGQNDVFKPLYLGIENLRVFRVFNRWGEKIFETTSKDVGWDGTYKGTPQEVGTYAYYVEGETSEGKIISKEGTVTLIR